MSIPQELLDLMQRFRDNERQYRDAGYNETETRRELIDPFFKALGWDVDNTQGYSEKYKEVVHEARVKVGRATKAPDYAFRVGGQPIFFVEAKKPAVRLADDAAPAYQVRRYAWSAKLPVGILTNFAEFALYDCRFKPAHRDHPATARVLYFTFEEYPDRWEELAALLSPEAVRKGALDRFVESKKSKRGTQAVDDAFLAEIEGWREALARNFALRNTLTVRQLNFAVQKTIDRIIFLRIAEDRGFEPYHRLGDVATTGGDLYRQLGELFRQADNRYNAGLFYFQPEDEREDNVDDFTLDLRLDDRVLKEIIGDLYYPESPYAFDALPADILGQVYERFLGSVIRLTPSGRAKVEEKPEVKKAGGVYYTPTYIVDYIVAHTVGRLVAGRSWREVRGLDARGARRYAPLRLVDPACGSGTFLLQAYQFLLDWYLARYVEDGAEAHARAGRLRAIIGGGDASWRLTTEERKEILLTHIYGVDIDPQAVEVAKLSLLLKVLEGEDEESLGAQLTMSLAGEARVLPDLTANIRCGNSLIGSDFYTGEQLTLGLVDEETMYRINAFDWDAPHGFPQAMAAGGFDAVIGNPPYVLLQGDLRDDEQVDYFHSKYSTPAYKVDTYHIFIEKGIEITKAGGRFSMITPSNFLTNNYLDKLRRFILQETSVDHIMVIDEGVFKGISVDTSIFVFVVGEAIEDTFPIIHAEQEGSSLEEVSRTEVFAKEALKDELVLFTGSADRRLRALWRRVSQMSTDLGRIAYVNFGKQLRNRKKFTEDVIEIETLEALPEGYRPCYTGRNVNRYHLEWGNLACLDKQVARKGGCWNAQRQNAKNKLLTRQIGHYPEFAIDRSGYQCLNTMFMVNLKRDDYRPEYVLGLLNSGLMRAFWVDKFYDQRRTFPKIKGTYLKQLPIRTIDFSDPDDVAHHDEIVALVERMLDLHARLAEAKTPQAKRLLQQQIAVTDRAIDDLVYALYGLTAAEIAVVAGA